MPTIFRPARNIWNWIRCESTDGVPPLPKEGDTWWDPCAGVARQYNGTAWEYFHFSSDTSGMGIAGYVCGGSTGYATTATQRMMFATETVASVSATQQGSSTVGTTGVASLQAGYIHADLSFSGTWTTRMQKFVFSSESYALLTSTCVNAIPQIIGLPSDTSKGYNWGGKTNYPYYNDYSGIDRITYGTDSIALISATVPRTCGGFNSPSGVTNVSTGWVFGNYNYYYGSSTADTNNYIDRMVFSTETTSTLSTNMSSPRSANSVYTASVAYLYGGYSHLPPFPATGVSTNICEKFAFFTETLVSMSNAISGETGTSRMNGGAAGYIAGGLYPGYAGIQKINFSTDAYSVNTSTLSAPLWAAEGFENRN